MEYGDLGLVVGVAGGLGVIVVVVVVVVVVGAASIRQVWKMVVAVLQEVIVETVPVALVQTIARAGLERA